MLEQRNINVSLEEWNNFDKARKSSLSFVSRSLQKLGINNFEFNVFKGDDSENNGKFNTETNTIMLNADGKAVDIQNTEFIHNANTKFLISEAIP